MIANLQHILILSNLVMIFEAFYQAIREPQYFKIKCLKQNAQSARGYTSETVDRRGLALSTLTSEPKKTP